MNPFHYWASGAGLSQVTPHDLPLPEGQDFPEFLKSAVGGRNVVEFGCGPGRLAGFFDPARYLGVDICAAALERAAQERPQHQFKLIDDVDNLPSADVVLCHTVMLHIPDELLAKTIGRLASDAVIISEILGRKWRRDGEPPVFNREAMEYALAFGQFGYVLASHVERPYPYYRDTNLTVMEFRRVSAQRAPSASAPPAAAEPMHDRSVLDASSPARPRRTRGVRPDS